MLKKIILNGLVGLVDVQAIYRTKSCLMAFLDNTEVFLPENHY